MTTITDLNTIGHSSDPRADALLQQRANWKVTVHPVRRHKSAFQPYDLLALRWIYGVDGLRGSCGLNSTHGPSLDFETPVTAMTATARADELTGTGGSDTMAGLAGNDTLTGLAGNDSLDGGGGLDLAAYGGLRAAYSVLKRPRRMRTR